MNPSTPAHPCSLCLAGRSKRDSLKTLAGAALALGGLPHSGAAADAPQAGDWLVAIDDEALKPIGPADLKTGEKQLIVFPFDPAAKRARNGSRLNRILLIKLDPANLSASARARGADGVLAYSAICTHQACDVNSWRAKEQTLLCFCHFSQFQPAEDAAVVSGPAPRGLPWLPLKADGARLVLAGGFSEPPGGAG